MSNAIRYTAEGSISLTCETRSENEWVFEVRDTGVGIKKEDLDRIFEAYYRGVARDNTYLPNSAGLGLAIVSRLVKLLQGRIQVESEVNVGSTFTVILPMKLQV